MASIERYLNAVELNKTNAYPQKTSSVLGGMNSYVQNSSVKNDLDGLRKELIQEKRKRGLIEKIADYFKNVTGIGLGPKKIEKEISALEKGEGSSEKVKKDLSDYRISKENTAQGFGDLVSGTLAIGAYFKLSNALKMARAKLELTSIESLIDEMPKGFKGIKDILKSESKSTVAILPALMLLSGFTKWAVLKLNRIGSKEYKVENKEQLSKREFSKKKDRLNRQRHKQNFKNFYTGAFNGLLSPIAGLVGGIVGIPAYILSTTGIRFLTSKNDNKDKSAKSFGDNLKNNVVTNSLFALTLAIPALRKAKFSQVLDKNLTKVVKDLKGIKLREPNLPSSKTVREELTDILFNSPRIREIELESYSDINGSIHELINENIFAAKLKQISNDGSALSSALIENCPPTRTMQEAQKEINKLLNHNKYKVSKLLGVGTIAETYLAKDASGKEVCIKILKDGINAEKIQRDKEAFIEMVTNGVARDKLTKSQEYFVKNIENLAESVSKEIDFENEMKAAIKLSKSTKQAAVVVPIEAKQGVYVMERAPGISLDTLVKYYQNEMKMKSAEAIIKKGSLSDEVMQYAQNQIEECTKNIEKLKAKSPDFKDFDLSNGEINLLLKKYIDVMVEQFVKVDKNGKTLHADIHPGNIFINLEALKGKKGKLFTLIDTGNTIDLSKEQALKALKLTSFIKNGNTKDIASYVLNGAVLPKNLTEEKALGLVENDLKKIFFDKETKIDSMNVDNILGLTDNILRKHNIISSDTQLTLNKAKASADKSLKGLIEAFFVKKYSKILTGDVNNKTETVSQIAGVTKDVLLYFEKKSRSNTVQETRNLLNMPLKEAMKILRNPNMIKTNSEEHLTYKLKQAMQLQKSVD